MAAVVLDQVRKVFPGPRGRETIAIRDLSLTVEDREFVVLVGPSGCGKTTTLRLIAGLETPSGGAIRLDGRVVNGLAPKERDVAMVFQHHALYPHLTVLENLAFGLRLRRLPRGEIRQRVQAAAALLGLEGVLNRRPSQISGGERQRVALGRAIVRRPKVFLFDEPLSHLDAPRRAELRRELAQLRRELGATILYVTHDQHEAMSLGDRIAVMNEGAIQQAAAPLDLYRQPENLFVAGFIGSPPMNLQPARLRPHGAGVALALGEDLSGDATQECLLPEEVAAGLRHCHADEIVVGVRPEHLRIAEELDCAAGVTMLGEVGLIEPLGADILAHITVAGTRVVARLDPSAPLPNRGPTRLCARFQDLHFFDRRGGQSLRSGAGAAVRS